MEREELDSEIEEMLDDLQVEIGDKFNRKNAIKLIYKYD